MKRLFLFSAVLLLAAAGCTNKKNVPSSEAWIWDESLPVPISFESGGGLGVETKAAINSLEGVDIGLYALSVDVGDAGNGPWPANWQYNETRLLENEKVGTDGNGTIVVKDKYYPNDNKYNYSFYAYAPYTDDVTPSTDWIGINFTLGETDIIYGESHATVLSGDLDSRYGFKASYIRRVKANDPRFLPHIEFNHKLTGLSFYAKLNATSPDESVESNYTIKTIAVLNTTTRARLYFADKTAGDGNKTGRLEGLDTPDNTTIFVGGRENSLEAKLRYGDYNETAGPIGQVFLMPGDSYEIEVTYEVSSAEGTPLLEETVSAAISRGGGFKAGNNHKVMLNITPLEPLEITTDLIGWNNDIPSIEVVPTSMES